MLPNEVIIINGGFFRVKKYEPGIKLQKGLAYQFDSLLHKYILPYRGKYKKMPVSEWERCPPGIYSTSCDGRIIYKFPRGKERNEYLLDNVKDLKNHTVYDEFTYIDRGINLTIDGDTFHPEIRPNDDLNNTVFKVGLNLKDINNDWYGPRLEQIDSGTNVANRKSNAKKAIMTNSSLSSNKLLQYAHAYDMQVALVIANKDDAIHPMKFDKIVSFSNGPFDLSDAVNIDDIRESWDINFKHKSGGEDEE